MILRRALVVSVVSVVASAAAALAFVPGISNAGRAWTARVSRSENRSTLDPTRRSSLGDTAGFALDNGAGIPGTYCPIPTKNDSVGTRLVKSETSNEPLADSA